SYDHVDEFGLAPTGWREWLRESARKSFILITDDNSSVPIATFENGLLSKGPTQFGPSLDARNYDVHAIVGLLAKMPPATPYAPEEPVQVTKCPSAVDRVAAHQNLSRNTGGLRFPVCATGAYGAILAALADALVKKVPIACTFPLPALPP